MIILMVPMGSFITRTHMEPMCKWLIGLSLYGDPPIATSGSKKLKEILENIKPSNLTI